MRSHPELALRYVAHAWFESVRFGDESDYDRTALADVLTALAAADPSEISARGGPREWAQAWHKRRRKANETILGTYQPLERKLAHAARDLVKEIDVWTAKSTRRVKPATLAANAFLYFAMTPGNVWGPQRTGDVEQVMIAKVKTAYRRIRVTSSMLAKALMVGWGISESKADGALKRP